MHINTLHTNTHNGVFTSPVHRNSSRYHINSRNDVEKKSPNGRYKQLIVEKKSDKTMKIVIKVS